MWRKNLGTMHVCFMLWCLHQILHRLPIEPSVAASMILFNLSHMGSFSAPETLMTASVVHPCRRRTVGCYRAGVYLHQVEETFGQEIMVHACRASSPNKKSNFFWEAQPPSNTAAAVHSRCTPTFSSVLPACHLTHSKPR